MNNILDGKTGTLTILLADPHTEEATNQIKEIVKNLTNNHTPTLLYEFITEEYWKELKLNKEQLKKTEIYWERSPYIEDICFKAKENKKLKVLLIDDLEMIQARERYCLGRADIVSIIVKQLKELAQELNIHIIATAPTSPETTSNELSTNKSKVLSYFCKAETAQEYIDNIYLLKKENNYNE